MTANDSDADRDLMKSRPTGEDQVRMVARQLSEPRTAYRIASKAKHSQEQTTRILERLVDNGILQRNNNGLHTTYYPDHRYQAIHEANTTP